MKDLGWNVEYFSWPEYKLAMVAGSGDEWDIFKKADLVFGGIDFSCDFLYFSIFHIEIRLTLIIHRNPSMNYGLTLQDTCMMFVNSLLLAKETTIWPHPEDLFLGGSKLQCYATLQVASLSMGISTPFYVTAGENVRDPTFVKDFADGKIQGVLKRDYSMMCQHVILPASPNATLKIAKSLREEEETWEKVKELFGMPKWFVQPIVAHLLYVGEVRCFIVSGRLVSRITTTPSAKGPDSPLEVTNYTPIRPLHTHS